LAGNYEAAVHDLDQALVREPAFWPALLNRGVSHWLAGDLPRAEADFTSVLAAPAERRLMEAAYYRGQILLSQGRDREAMNDFSAVLDELPHLTNARWFRAQAHFRLGDEQAAVADVQSLVASREGAAEPASQLAVGKTLRSLAMELDGEASLAAWRQAAEALERWVEVNPSDAEGYSHRGAVEQDLGRLDRAIAYYSKGLELAPESAPLRTLRGWAYDAKGQLAQALVDFHEAVRLSPANAEAHTGLGYVLARSGASDLARQEASTALLYGADDYRVLHNIACIYAQLSTGEGNERLEYENLALSLLQRAVALWQQNRAGPDERELIRMEPAFPPTLRSRIEYARLIGDAQNDSGKP
jgi:tetratricopeptide (TPR) repeat protein